MPRQPRFFFPGAVLHIIQRGNNRAAVFTSSPEHRFYLESLRVASRSYGVAIHAYVLMTNHVHLLVSPDRADSVPGMMQSLGRKYVGCFNMLHQRTGTLWEGRYRATLVDTDAYLFACSRYIELNPVRAGIAAAPGDYRWSSYRTNACGEADPVVTPHPAFLALSDHAERRYAAYRGMFADALSPETMGAIREATQFEWALGGAAFRARVETMTYRRTDRRSPGRPRVSPCGRIRL